MSECTEQHEHETCVDNLWKELKSLIGYWIKIAMIIYGFCPLGIVGFIAARFVYEQWSDALVFYAVHMGMAASSIVCIIPIYGNKLHFIIAQNYLLPWAFSYGVHSSWLMSISGFLAGTLGAMFSGTFIYHVIFKPIFKPIMFTMFGPITLAGAVVLLSLAIFVIGTIYSGMLFF